MTHPPFSVPAKSLSRRGSALIVVLVVIVLLTLGALTYSNTMITEYRAARMAAHQVTSRAWAESGVEYVAALVGPDNSAGVEVDMYDNPSVFQRAMLGGGFSIMSPIEDDQYTGTGQETGVALRYGVIDECAKLNVNTLAGFDPGTGQGRDMLMAVPLMTENAADGILDWIDSDEDPREYGADGLDYTLVMPRNGPLQSIEELVLASGVTPDLLFGEDANRNGLLDPSENDGDKSLPLDNADGVLDMGWSEYLTVYSREVNTRRDPDYFGEAKYYVNNDNLQELYDEIVTDVGEEAAQFIIALRRYGPYDPASSPGSSSGGSTSGGSSSGGSSGSGSSGGTSGGSGSTGSGSGSSGSGSTPQNPLQGGSDGSTTTTGDAATDQSLEQIANGVANSLFSAGGGTVTRGGIDITQGASYTLTSLYDLVDAEVQGDVNGTKTTLVSPWSSSGGNLAETLPLLLDAFTITEQTVIKGRVNINQARYEVLASIPGMPEGVPEAIISARAGSSSTGRGSSLDIYGTNGWPLMQGLIDIQTMRKIDPFITARGDVFRFQVVANATEGPVSRVEAVLDATEPVPKVVYRRDLAPLGPGFRKEQLPVFSGP